MPSPEKSTKKRSGKQRDRSWAAISSQAVPSTVGGFPGFRGTYSVGLFLPDRCMIEMIPLEDRFIVRGYMAWSSEVSNQGGDATEAGKIDSKKEQEEFKHFSEALYVGPKPGFFSN